MVGRRLTDERMAVFPEFETPTNSTVFLVDFDFLRANTVITAVKTTLASLIAQSPIGTYERAAMPPARTRRKVFA